MISFRLSTPLDRQFIVSGWSASYKRSRDVAFIPDSMWAQGWYHPIIEHHLDRPGVETVVAEGSVLQGFICYEPDYVLYCYVAQPFRGRGIARRLFRAAGINPESRFRYAARTRASWQVAQAGKIPLAVYDSMSCRFKEQNEQRNAQ